MWWTAGGRWELHSGSCHRHLRVSESRPLFCLICPFRSVTFVVWRRSQAKEGPGWKPARCKFGWKTARISLQSEGWLSIPLWSGNIGHWRLPATAFSLCHVCWNLWTHPCMFCCSAVLPDTSRKSRQKTRVVKRTASPMFNHTMVYDGFRPEDLKEACVEITVWDHDRLNNQYIGGLRLGLGTGEIPLYWSCEVPMVSTRKYLKLY